SGEMPPRGRGRPRPTPDEVALLVRAVSARLPRFDCGAESDPGRVTLRPLHRAQDNHTTPDLVGADLPPPAAFPPDTVGSRFDKIGDVLTLPPLLLEKYLAAAEQIAERAIVADDPAEPATVTYQAEDLDPSAGGEPFEDSARALNSEGEIVLAHRFARGGEYR